MAFKFNSINLIVTLFVIANIECRINTGTLRNFTVRDRRAAAAADCESGYTKNWWGKCVDINECDGSTTDICPGGQCVNTEGSYECKPTEPAPNPSSACPDGYKANWWGKCVDIDECQEQGICGSDLCENTDGSYVCIRKKEERLEVHCAPGFFHNVVLQSCDDIDECSMELDNCMEQTCENTIGSFRCNEQKCYPGYEHTTAGCQDIDECKRLREDACFGDEVCHNTKGSFVCQKCIRKENELQCYQRKQCMPGFEPSKLPFYTCTDVDECQRDFHDCSTEEKCVNTIPGYRCECRDGFTRNLKNQCSIEYNNCGVDNICPDLTQSNPCPAGYKLSSDRLKCEDVDECTENARVCNANQECHNFRGGYRCYVNLV